MQGYGIIKYIISLKENVMRDYQKNPLKRRVEKPPKEDLEQLYFVKNCTLVEISEYLKRTRRTIITWFNEYNIPKKDESKILETRKRTNLKKFGVDNPFKDVERVRQGCIKKFGVDNIFKRKDIIKQAMISKYGVSNPSQNVLIQNKKYETMKNNHSYNISKKEEIVYSFLVNKFGNNNIVRQYKSKEYPYNCDFYIKSLNLYVEYNGHFTHGREPFDKSNTEHLKILDKWKQKNTRYYQNAIEIWTNKDVQKLKTFQKYNLNYKIFYTIDDFKQWYKTI